MIFSSNINYYAENGSLFKVKPNKGIKCILQEVNTDISDEDIKILPIRELVSIIDISQINKRYVKDLVGNIYSVNLLEDKKDEEFRMPTNKDECCIYNILSFNYGNYTQQELNNLFIDLRRLTSSNIKGKLAEDVILQLFCRNELFLDMFMGYTGSKPFSADGLAEVLYLECKNHVKYTSVEIRKFCRDITENYIPCGPLLRDGEYRWKFALFVHLYEKSGVNKHPFFYIEHLENTNKKFQPGDTSINGVAVVRSSDFDPNFKSSFLSVPFNSLMQSKITDYLTSIKEYMSQQGQHALPVNYEYIKLFADYYKEHDDKTTLEDTNKKQKQIIAEQKQTIATLTQKNATMEQTIATQGQTIVAQEQAITKLRSEMRKMRALLNIPSSSEDVEDISNS